MKLRLWGAYHRLVRPLEQRTLAVHLSFDRSANLQAVIDAEELAAQERVHFEARRSGFVVDYRMQFSGDDGAAYTLELVQRLDEWTLRGWTELAGPLVHEGTAAWGRACLRLDYRDTNLRQLWLALRGAKIVS